MDLLADTHLVRFTLGGHGLATYPAGATFGPRLNSDFEFVWLVEGDAVWEVDGQEIPAPAGTVLLVRPGMRDAFRWDPQRRTRHGFFHFRLDPGSATLPPDTTWPLSRPPRADDVLRPLFHHLAWLIERRPPGWKELAQGALRQAFLAYIMGADSRSGEASPEEHPLLVAVQAHIRELWAEGELPPITLGDLARAAGVSKVHLTRVFQQELGVPPVEALRLLRLDRAASLLARTNHPVAAIARLCGFANPFHFSRAFRQQYAASPREIRERTRRGASLPTLALTRVRDFSVGVDR